jgi:putative glutamine amidotransferase
MLKIGVSACFLYPDTNRTVFGPKTLCYLEQDMARYLSRPGIMPILIPDLPQSELLPILREMDGFVFQGGTDISPQSYGEQPIENGRWPGDAFRDEYELHLMEYAVKAGKPVFGICRGFQLMNVYFGGTLYQDIATQFETKVQHRHALQYDQVHHDLHLIAGGLMADLHADESINRVNSVHHQAVKDLGKGLEVQARSAEDGLIEAFLWSGEAPGKIMGVQWHPEFFHNSQVALLNAEKVYEVFLGYCGK